MFFRGLFRGKSDKSITNVKHKRDQKKENQKESLSIRKGDLGEYKIEIQLSQLPKNYLYLNDLMIQNNHSSTGYSQIDHIILTPYAIFVIETKNYQGTIYGSRDRKTWLVNGTYKMLNPFNQNYGHIQALKQFIKPSLQARVISMVSFTKRCTFKIELELRKIQSDQLIIYDVELTEYINRKIAVLKLQGKEPLLSDLEIEDLYQTLVSANIKDLTIRNQHIHSIQSAKSNPTQNKANICSVCRKPVSEKVASYCMSNKTFNGNIYCWQHQKRT